jgi:hypothetical protein
VYDVQESGSNQKLYDTIGYNRNIVPDCRLERHVFQNFGLSHLEHQETPHLEHNEARSVRCVMSWDVLSVGVSTAD